jgi:hypothetical protein
VGNIVKFQYIVLFTLISLVIGVGFAVADRLPNETPENQIFSIDTIIDVTGMVSDSTRLSWVIASPGSIPTGILGAQQSIADISYRDSILTNGGKLSMNKNFAFDSRNKAKGLFNIEAEKVLTYASTEGAHMVGEEEYTLSVAGNFADAEDNIRCVFSKSDSNALPAFCNIVSAKSSLINVNSAQISTKGQIRGVSASADVPAELNYRIAVTPDSNSGSGYAEGTVTTTFQGTVMEARDGAGDNWNKTAAENTWKDTTSVTGGIKMFQKAFAYQSGFRL